MRTQLTNPESPSSGELNYLAERRFLNGERKPPFFLYHEKMMAQGLNQFVRIGREWITYDESSKLKCFVLTESLESSKIINIKDNVDISVIKPIKKTNLCCFLDKKFHINVISISKKVCTLENITTFSNNSFDFAVIHDKLYLFIAHEQDIRIFNYDVQKNVFRDVASWNVRNFNNLTGLSHFSINNNHYLVASCLSNVSFTQINPNRWDTFDFSPVVHVECLTNQMIVRLVTTNDTHMAVVEHEYITIVPLQAVVDKNTKSVPVRITQAVIRSIFKTDILAFLSSQIMPMLMTNHTLVLATLGKDGIKSGTTLAAFSVYNGQMTFIKKFMDESLKFIANSNTGETQIFSILTNNGAYTVDYKNEKDCSRILPLSSERKYALADLRPNKQVLSSEILSYHIGKQNYADAIMFTEHARQNSEANLRQVYNFLVNEIELLTSVMDTKPLSTLSLNCDDGRRAITQLKMHPFHSVYELLSDKSFIKNIKPKQLAMKTFISLGEYDEALTMATTPDLLNEIINEISIRSPESLERIIIDLSADTLLEIIPQNIPFFAHSFKTQTMMKLCKMALSPNSVLFPLLPDLIWGLAQTKDCVEVDLDLSVSIRAVSHLDRIPWILHSLRSSKMTTSEAVINKLFNSSTQSTTNMVHTQPKRHYESKEEIANRIDEILKGITQDVVKAKNNAQIFENDLFIQDKKPKNAKRCCYCGKGFGRDNYFLFPCGHGFHDNCLLLSVRPLLFSEDKTKLDNFIQSSNTKEIEKIISDDCPKCGVLSANAVLIPAVSLTDNIFK